MKPSSPQGMPPASIYGLDAVKPFKFKQTSSKNRQEVSPGYRFSSTPITQGQVINLYDNTNNNRTSNYF